MPRSSSTSESRASLVAAGCGLAALCLILAGVATWLALAPGAGTSAAIIAVDADSPSAPATAAPGAEERPPSPPAAGTEGEPGRDPEPPPTEDPSAGPGAAPKRDDADAARLMLDGVTDRLLALQDGDGGWRTDDPRWGKRGATALGVLFFLGKGVVPGAAGEGKALARALELLRAAPAEGGHPYADAAAALALSECAALLRAPPEDPLHRSALEAIAIVESAALPGGGWSAAGATGGEAQPDVGVSGLSVMALKSSTFMTGQSAADGGALSRAREWFAAHDPSALDLGMGESLGGEHAAIAVGVLTRAFLGVGEPDDPAMQGAAELLVASPPSLTDHLHAYLASMALFQVGDSPWQTWRDHLEERFTQGAPTDPAEAALVGLSACIAARYDSTRVSRQR